MAENTAPHAPDVDPGTADLGTVLAMVQSQLRASAEREDRLTALLEKALHHEKPSPPVAGPPAPPPLRSVKACLEISAIRNVWAAASRAIVQ